MSDWRLQLPRTSIADCLYRVWSRAGRKTWPSSSRHSQVVAYCINTQGSYDCQVTRARSLTRSKIPTPQSQHCPPLEILSHDSRSAPPEHLESIPVWQDMAVDPMTPHSSPHTHTQCPHASLHRPPSSQSTVDHAINRRFLVLLLPHSGYTTCLKLNSWCAA